MNGMGLNEDDSPVITIEYLRARLLSERSISKAAKERADGLSERVKKLEDQLKIVSLLRKKAEKSTLDVLSYLESHEVGDLSKLYESESDEEDSLCKSNMGKFIEDKNFGSLESERNSKESSGSDHESAPSSAGSLSWKGRKKTAQLFEKEYFDLPTRRHTTSPPVNSLPRRRHGKSCRQVKRREARSVVKEPSHDSLNSDVQDNNALDGSGHHANRLDTCSDKLKRSPERQVDRGSRRNEVPPSFQDQTQDSDASSPNNRGHELTGVMERALKHKAPLIGLNEAQEQPQRDWEDKYRDNQVSKQDSYEPGNQSDVTEARDENKVGISHAVETTADHGNDQKEGGSETKFQTEQLSVTHMKSFKFSPDADKLIETQDFGFPALDFAFPSVNDNQRQNHEDGQSSNAIKNEIGLSNGFHVVNVNGSHSIVPHEESDCPGGILGALQEAKLILNQQMSSLPKSIESAHTEIKTSSAINDADWLNIPVACPSLFRVPTDLYPQGPNQLPDNSHRFGGQFFTSGGNPEYATELGNFTRSRFGFHSNSILASSSKSALQSYSSSPDIFPSPNGIPPSRNPLFYEPYMYS